MKIYPATSFDSHRVVQILSLYWNGEDYDMHVRDWLLAYWTGAR